MMADAADSNTGGQSGAPTVRRMVLGAQLRRLREAAEISRADAGYAIRASESKMSRIELGKVGFKDRDVADLLTVYGVNDDEERDVFLSMVKESNLPGWWHRYGDVIPTWFNDYVGLEESASRIQAFEHQFIPGLLQTEEYARAVVTHGNPDRATAEDERRIVLRMQRQRVLARPSAPRLWVVIDESVLHRPIGGRTVLRDQIDHLLRVSKLPHISLQVLTFAHSTNPAEGAFTLLRFAEAELPTAVYVEHLTGALYLDRLDEIEKYSRALDRLAVDAETPDNSRHLLTKMREEI
jgi:transcriptional regulator with XRE-family HTH domain